MALHNPFNPKDPDLKGSPKISARRAVQAEEANDDAQDMSPTTQPGMEDAAAHGGRKGMKLRGKIAKVIASLKPPAGKPVTQTKQRD